MTTLKQLRTAALGLPEVTETTRLEEVSFAVGKRAFASVSADARVHLRLPEAEAEAALAAHPSAEPAERGGSRIGIRMPLADVNGKDLNALVRAAWASGAPKRLAASLAAASAGELPAGSDLPAGIGKPATRALLAAGIGTLDGVAALAEPDLLAMHGVGPKAVRILTAALAERGQQH